jgi:hypothetical protein
LIWISLTSRFAFQEIEPVKSKRVLLIVMLLIYLVTVWSLIDYPLGFWLFVLGVAWNGALRARNGSTYAASGF